MECGMMITSDVYFKNFEETYVSHSKQGFDDGKFHIAVKDGLRVQKAEFYEDGIGKLVKCLWQMFELW